jgi:SAM-dependent methyltransferase
VNRHHDFFASNASRYDDSRPPLLTDSPLAALIGTAALASQALILDVATGTGRVAIPLARAGYRVIGIDQAEEMLRALRRKAPDAGVTAVAATGRSLPFANAHFDVVLMARLLYLAADWRAILADAVRVLHPSGRLLHEWAGGTPDEPWVQIRERLRTLLEHAGIDEPFHPGARRQSDVDEFLATAGLIVVDEVKMPLDSTMTLGDFLDRMERGDFSYTWKGPPDIQKACLADLKEWATTCFDLSQQAFARETSWKIYCRRQDRSAGSA